MADDFTRNIQVSCEIDFGSITGDPCRTLILGVIYAAIMDLVRRSERDRQDAYQWLHLAYESLPVNATDEEWSFGWCCDQLDLDGARVHKRIREAHYLGLIKKNAGARRADSIIRKVIFN